MCGFRSSSTFRTLSSSPFDAVLYEYPSMRAIEPMHSGAPSSRVTLPEYFVFVSSTNCFQLVGLLLDESVR